MLIRRRPNSLQVRNSLGELFQRLFQIRMCLGIIPPRTLLGFRIVAHRPSIGLLVPMVTHVSKAPIGVEFIACVRKPEGLRNLRVHVDFAWHPCGIRNLRRLHLAEGH